MNDKNGSVAKSQWLLPALLIVLACGAFVTMVICVGILLVLPTSKQEIRSSISTSETWTIPTLVTISTPAIENTMAPVVAPSCEDPECLNACLRQIPDFENEPLLREDERDLSEKQGGYDLVRYRLDEEDKTLKRIAIPTVPDYLIPYQEDEQLHRRIWDYFTGIFPNDSDVHVSYLVVIMDGTDDGYSAAIWSSQGKWRLYVNLLEFDSSRDVIEILTHEYGHMLTLNDSQARDIPSEYGLEMEQTDFESMRSKCEGYFFTGSDCALADSYLNEFGNRFWIGELFKSWTDAYLLWDKEEGLYETAMDEFYRQYRDQFVTEYASTTPLEDIAESWTEFVMRPKPTGSTIADQKILFFYEYPELVDIRREIIQGVCQYAAEQK